MQIEEAATIAAATAIAVVLALLLPLGTIVSPAFPTGARRVTRLFCGEAASYSAGGA